MTAGPDEVDAPSAAPGLKRGAIGLAGVVFIALANAAPITALTGNVPIAVGFGNGLGAPAGFLFATIALTLFALGYVAQARHVTTTGAFYGFVSHGLGQLWGMASGLLATVAYVVFESAIVGAFAYFANDAARTIVGVDVDWIWFASLAILVIGVLGYFDIKFTAGILGVFLIGEVLLLTVLAASVVVGGGGPDGFLLDRTVVPQRAFDGLPAGAFGSAAAAGSFAIGLFFAFWSWVGFETTAVYGEESRDPRRIIPRATLIAVIGLGAFYTVVSALVIAGNGAKAAVEKAISANPLDLYFTLLDTNLGSVALDVYKVLLFTGSFACALAFHNAAARYLYALARETPWRRVRNTLGATHRIHRSPHLTSIVQSVVTLAVIGSFAAFTTVQVPNPDGGGFVDTPALVPYTNVFGLLGLLGTAAILLVQAISSVAVIGYFWVRKAHRGNVFTTLIAPALGAVALLWVVWTLWSNRSFAAGYAAESPVLHAAPFIIAGTLLLGLGYAAWLRTAKPDVYAAIGRSVLVESHERLDASDPSA